MKTSLPRRSDSLLPPLPPPATPTRPPLPPPSQPYRFLVELVLVIPERLHADHPFDKGLVDPDEHAERGHAHHHTGVLVAGVLAHHPRAIHIHDLSLRLH